jgi:hypothetical protein|nr:MAG: hypothetical protein [Bacteriophage sp.]UWI17231.1 MAG: hypothetical protein [Bacteriophage sp.]
MRIKGMDGQEHNVTGQGQGNLNTVLGAIGTAGVLGGNRCGGGLFGGLFGGGCNDNCDTVSQRELAYAVSLAACQGREYALETARQEAAAIFAESRRTDDKIAGVVKETNQGLVAVGNGVSRLDAKVQCLEEKLGWVREESNRNLRESKEYTDCRVTAEAQLRKAGDDNIVAWTQGELNKKIDGTLKLDGGQISYGSCKPVLQNCPCGSEQNPFNVNVVIEQAVAAAIKAVSGK